MGYVDSKPHIYYYILYVLEHPEYIKALNVLLDDDLFSESTDVKRNGKNRQPKVPGSNKTKPKS
jgi:hypothetical protein